MSKIFFFTSNRVKRAHLRHIADDYGIELHSFREDFYRATEYKEPRIEDRAKLLALSHGEALKMWERASPPRDDLFFLEDTSVRIEALSTVKEVPGTDVKYWMKTKTWNDLDREINRLGGDRGASVRSDIVLHLPSTLRQVKGGERFQVFTGVVSGRVCEKDLSFETNLLYPWLDNKTFNRWFIPGNAEIPLGNMTIRDSRNWDFRRIAFEKMVAFLIEYGVVSTPISRPRQLSIPGLPPNPPITSISGGSCAGKTTIGKEVCTTTGALHIEASDFMREALYSRFGFRTAVGVSSFAESALSQDPSIVPRAVFRFSRRFSRRGLVLTGLRSPEELDHLAELFADSRSVHTFFVDASVDVRFERARRRGRGDTTSSSLEARESLEERLGLWKVRSLPNSILLANEIHDPSLLLIPEVASPLIMIHKGEQHSAVDESELAYFSRRALETAVLQTLFSHSVTEDFLTSTEIAKLTRKVIQGEHHKDNISRFLNQIPNPMFEVRLTRSKVSFRLSQTGRSVAQLASQLPPFVRGRQAMFSLTYI